MFFLSSYKNIYRDRTPPHYSAKVLILGGKYVLLREHFCFSSITFLAILKPDPSNFDYDSIHVPTSQEPPLDVYISEP
jgi:hypothetical protein